jgi:hypothetical protein
LPGSALRVLNGLSARTIKEKGARAVTAMGWKLFRVKIDLRSGST